MKTKKLSKSQTAALRYLIDNATGDFYSLLRAGANGVTTSNLVKLGLLHLDLDDLLCKSYIITEDGRKALADGEYVLP